MAWIHMIGKKIYLTSAFSKCFIATMSDKTKLKLNSLISANWGTFFMRKKRNVSKFSADTHCPPMWHRFPYVRFDLTPTVHLLCDIGFQTLFGKPLPPFYKSTYIIDGPKHPLFSHHTNYLENQIHYHCLDRALWRDKKTNVVMYFIDDSLSSNQRNYYNEIIWCCISSS